MVNEQQDQLTAAEALKKNYRDLMLITSPSQLCGEITRIIENKPFADRNKDSFWSAIAALEGRLDSLRMYVTDFILGINNAQTN